MRNSKVSLCMIVKDEADSLAACLESASPYVDEICIVDTGSTDDTVAIARRFGARLEEMAWPNDFAVARNRSLAMASGDWILVLDADEVLRGGAEEAFADVVDDPKAIAAFQNVTNHGDGGKSVSCLIMRLFRNMPEHRFEGAIHEQVITPILENRARFDMVVVESLLDIDHYGYTEAARQNKQKDERNRLHFEKALEQDPGNAYLWFKYGDFLRRFEKVDPVLEALGRAVQIVSELSDADVADLTYPAEPHALLALELIKMDRVEDARRVLETARQRLRVTPMLHWVWGHLNLKLENWSEALLGFESCHALDGACVHVPAQPGITSGRSVFGMARALLGMGKKDEAMAMFESGAAKWPDCADLQKAMARIKIAQRDFSGAIQVCTSFLKKDDSDAEFWQIGAEMMLEVGMWEKAAVWVARAQSGKSPENEGLCNGTAGECALGRSELESALDLWSLTMADPICKSGLILVRIMLAEPIPDSVDLDAAALHVGLNAILRRLKRAPAGEQLCQQIWEGLVNRPLQHIRLQKILEAQLVASLPLANL